LRARADGRGGWRGGKWGRGGGVSRRPGKASPELGAVLVVEKNRANHAPLLPTRGSVWWGQNGAPKNPTWVAPRGWRLAALRDVAVEGGGVFFIAPRRGLTTNNKHGRPVRRLGGRGCGVGGGPGWAPGGYPGVVLLNSSRVLLNSARVPTRVCGPYRSKMLHWGCLGPQGGCWGLGTCFAL
jgi:hypothetical protein